MHHGRAHLARQVRIRTPMPTKERTSFSWEVQSPDGRGPSVLTASLAQRAPFTDGSARNVHPGSSLSIASCPPPKAYAYSSFAAAKGARSQSWSDLASRVPFADTQ